MAASPARRRLEIDADLEVTVDGEPVSVRGDGSRLVIDVPDRSTAFRLFQSARPGRGLVRTITDTLDVFGINVDVRVGERTVATLGADADPGPVSRALGRAVGADGLSLAPPELTPRVRWGLVGLAFALGLAVGTRR